MNEQEQHQAHGSKTSTSAGRSRISNWPAGGNAQGLGVAGVGVGVGTLPSAGKVSTDEPADTAVPSALLGEARAMQLDGKTPAAQSPNAWLESEPVSW